MALTHFIIAQSCGGTPTKRASALRELSIITSTLGVIHFVRYETNEFWILTIYAKAKRDDVPAHILKQLLEAFRNG